MTVKLYEEYGTYVPDKLIAGNGVPILTKLVTLAKGQGLLKRGSVLGVNPADSKYYLVSKAAEPVVKRTLQITGTTTKTAVLEMAGLDDETLKVYVGDNYGELAEAGADKDYTATYADDTLTITVVTTGKLNGVSQCYIEINGVAGANEADCILADDTDTGGSDATADVKALAYRSGCFNRDALIFGGADPENEIPEDASTDHEARLRELGIFLVDHI